MYQHQPQGHAQWPKKFLHQARLAWDWPGEHIFGWECSPTFGSITTSYFSPRNFRQSKLIYTTVESGGLLGDNGAPSQRHMVPLVLYGIKAYKAQLAISNRHWIEVLRGLQYKLSMMDMPLTSPSFIYGDNKSQVTNSARPKLTLKEVPFNLLPCNAICESIAKPNSILIRFPWSIPFIIICGLWYGM